MQLLNAVEAKIKLFIAFHIHQYLIVQCLDQQKIPDSRVKTTYREHILVRYERSDFLTFLVQDLCCAVFHFQSSEVLKRQNTF